MLVSAAVCEFNPFHNGHKYLLEKMREDDAYTVCIMSGNFVQRGEFAVCDKFIRAESAVKSGADLVIELPLPYALGTAETFARGAIGILDRLNIVDRLYFGSESTKENLYTVKEKIKTQAFKNETEKLMKDGMSYPDAVFAALGENTLCGGNDILGVEYLKQLDNLKSKIEPYAIKRVGNKHDSSIPTGEFASASLIRQMLYKNESTADYMPFEIEKDELSDFSKLEYAVLNRLRQMNEDDFSKIADVSEGLEYRFYKAVSQAKSLDEVFENVRTKRYTLSKIRRIILCSFLGVTKDMQNRIPGFVTVLSANKRGEELISRINKESEIVPVIRYSDTKTLKKEDRELYTFTSKCDDIFGLSLPEIRETGYDMKRKFRKV